MDRDTLLLILMKKKEKQKPMKKRIIFMWLFAGMILLFVLQPQAAFAQGTSGAVPDAPSLGWLTIIPPAVAIILAFLTKEVVLSLTFGVFSGAYILQLSGGSNIFMGTVGAFNDIVQYAVNALADPWNAGLILQVMTIGGLITVITKTGGARAVAEGLSKYAKGPVSTQIITWILGLFIFFDDYANSLIVGPIMQPVSDKLSNSRERLAFVVDATAAPVTGVALISTWIGYEIGLISEAFQAMGADVNAYGFFLETLPFRFYNWLMLAFVVITSLTLREFGPMKKAQRRSRDKGYLIDPKSTKQENTEADDSNSVKGSIWNAIVPIGSLIIFSFIGFYTNGRSALLADGGQQMAELFQNSPFSFAAIREAFGASDASIVIFQAALAASIIAILMGVSQKRFSIGEGINHWINGMKSLIMTAVVLILAWSLSANMTDLGTAEFLVSLLSDAIPPFILPTLIFLFGAITSFATGSSFGTMGILIPLAIPLASAMAPNNPELTVITSASVLAGAILGDHSSPISDTTILSSMGTGSNLIDHVRTQLPYAVTVGTVAILFGYIPTALGASVWIMLPIGLIVLIAIVYTFGTKINTTESPSDE